MRTAQCSAVVLGVVVLDQLRLGRSLPEALRLGRGARRQEPQLALQVEQLLIRVGFHFDRLELLQQRVARQVLVHLGGSDQLALFVLDLLRHLLERLERALVFFFQAEDGIRDIGVTGVQTCALPIWVGRGSSGCCARCATAETISATPALSSAPRSVSPAAVMTSWPRLAVSAGIAAGSSFVPAREIGRASCRERVEVVVVVGSLKTHK